MLKKESFVNAAYSYSYHKEGDGWREGIEIGSVNLINRHCWALNLVSVSGQCNQIVPPLCPKDIHLKKN